MTIQKIGEWYQAKGEIDGVLVTGYSTYGHAEALGHAIRERQQVEECEHEFIVKKNRRERKCKKCGLIKAE